MGAVTIPTATQPSNRNGPLRLLILGITGIALGVSGNGHVRDGTATNAQSAKAGIVLGALSTLGAFGFIAFMLSGY